MTERSDIAWPMILVLDIEPGPRRPIESGGDDWNGMKGCIEEINAARALVLSRTGHPLRVSWTLRVDDQIERIYGSCGWLAALFRQNHKDLLETDEVGLHSHPYRWDDTIPGWIEDFGDTEWIESRLIEWVDVFRKTMGFAPSYFRYTVPTYTLRFLEILRQGGVKYDLTMAPGLLGGPVSSPDRGIHNDLTSLPLSPFQASRSNWKEAHHSFMGGGIWMLPRATGCLDHWCAWSSEHAGHRAEPLNLALDPEWFRRLFDSALDIFAIPLIEGRTGDLSRVEYHDNFLSNLHYLLNHRRLEDFAFETPARALNSYKSLLSSSQVSQKPAFIRKLLRSERH